VPESFRGWALVRKEVQEIHYEQQSSRKAFFPKVACKGGNIMWPRTKHYCIPIIFCLALVIFVTNPVDATSKPYEGQTLIVGVWSGPWAESFKKAIGDPFEQLTGAKIAYKYAWDFTPEIMAAPKDEPPLDIAESADSDFLVGIKNNLWLPIRYENVPNADKIFDYVWNEMYPGTKYGLPFSLGVHVLMYRQDLVEKPPIHWKYLFRDEYKGKIAIERWFPYWVYIGSYLTDYTPSTKAIYSDEGRDKILKQMQKLSDRWFFCYEKGAELISALDAGEVVVGNFWNGSATKLVMQQIKKYGEVRKINMVLPEEGSVCYRDRFSVVRGTEKRELAEKFLNYMIGTEAQRRFQQTHYAILTNKEVVGQVPQVMIDKHLQPLKDEDWKKFDTIDAEFLEPYRKKLEDRFMKEVLAR
jgi:spermidine/putrescine transport system substrate-binding protein